jgi:3'(2'), 5'-bisphosphate nucleotidase
LFFGRTVVNLTVHDPCFNVSWTGSHEEPGLGPDWGLTVAIASLERTIQGPNDDHDDHRLACLLAEAAGRALLDLRERHRPDAFNPWLLRDQGDQLAHDLLVDQLARHRPDDIVLSEEGAEDRRRLQAERTWIVDPLDGTHDFPFQDSFEWAVHVALVQGGRATAAAVSVPGLDKVFATDKVTLAEPHDRDHPLVVCGRSNTYFASEVADAIGGQVMACGSSGVKAMLVVSGAVDVYVHGSGLYEWDVCAPAAVGQAADLVVTDIHGDEIVYNKRRPVVEGLVISRPEYAELTRKTLDRLI